MERLPSPLIRGEPSLARRLRFFIPLASVVPSGADGAVEKLPATDDGSWVTGLFMLCERYDGVPTEQDSNGGLRPLPRRLAGIGEAAAAAAVGSPLLGSLTEAATAAATALVAAAVVVVTLLRREIRWLGLTAPREIE